MMHIKLENISKFYSSSTSVTYALQKVSLEFPEKGFVAITGESGSGKSTLISVLSGMLPFEEGEIYIDGNPMSGSDDGQWEDYRKDKIGFVFQEYNLIDDYTVMDNVELAITIRGKRKDDIKDFANKIIHQVGLEDFINQKACKLSSGQKQRLAIARALAKETDVIVADEPTGNLDSDNGKKIMELFAEIAKEKLVIMVTHNYDLAKPYINRSIRIFDGKIISDTQVNDIGEDAEISLSTDKELVYDSNKNDKNKLSWKYALKNFRRQPLMSLIIGVFVFITAVISYVFFGEIISNYDDTHTKIYDNDVFAYENHERIIVKKTDKSAMTEEDYNKFQSIKYVEFVEEYDLCNDIRYAYAPGEYYYLSGFNEDVPSKYMKSVSCIDENDLKEGRLPEARNEIVMYVEGDLKDVNELQVMIQNENLWGNYYYLTDFVIVGILKEETSQIYFSKAFCDMITAPYKQDEIRLEGAWCEVDKTYRYKDWFTPIISEDCEDKQIRLSGNYNMPYDPCVGMAHMNCERVSENYGTVNVSTGRLKLSGEIENLLYEDILLGHISTEILPQFLLVSEEFFYELYEKGSHQASLYIEHYAYTDEVIESLEKMGYDAISSYRVGALEYDNDKYNNRVRLLLISFAVLIVLAMIEVFIMLLFLRLRRKMYSVLKFMGMESKTIKRMNYIEINIYSIVALVIMFLGITMINMFNLIPWINEFKHYMDPIHYAMYIAYNLGLAQLIAMVHNRK